LQAQLLPAAVLMAPELQEMQLQRQLQARVHVSLHMPAVSA
jgi:hypothetical protein